MSKNFKVMLIEDNSDHAELTAMAIKRYSENVQVSIFDDGSKALEFLINDCDCESCAGKDNRPDIVLLDIKMPGMDGFEVLKKIKTNREYKQIPVIMLTTSNRPEDIENAYLLGANSYLTKPVGHNEMKGKISTLLNYWKDMNEYL